MRFHKYKPIRDVVKEAIPRHGLKSLPEEITAIRGVEYALTFIRKYPAQKLDLSVERDRIRVVNTTDGGAAVEFHAYGKDARERAVAHDSLNTLHTFLRHLSSSRHEGYWWIVDTLYVTEYRIRDALYMAFGRILGERPHACRRTVASLLAEIRRHDLTISSEIAVIDEEGDDEVTHIFQRRASA